MSVIAARRRRRSVLMAISTAAVLVVVPLLGYVGVRAVLDSTAGKDAAADSLPTRTFPDTPTGVMFGVADDGTLSSATAFVLLPSGAGGSIVPVPINSDVGFTDDQRRSIRSVFDEDGPEAAVVAVESLLLIDIDVWSVDTVDQLSGTLLALQPYDVTLVAGVQAKDPDDEIQPGKARLDAVGAATVLTAKAPAAPGDAGGGPDTTDTTGATNGTTTTTTTKATTTTTGSNATDTSNATDSTDATGGTDSPKPVPNEVLDESADRYSDAQAVWTAVATNIGGGRPPATAPSGRPATLDDLLARLQAGPVSSRGLVTVRLEPVQNPLGLDVVALDEGDVVFVFGSIAPGAMSAPKLGPIMRVEAPPGYDAQVARTIDKLLYIGANVVSVDTTGTPQRNTVFYAPDDADRDRVGTADAIFGSIEFGTPTVRIDGVDVTLVLGTDYLEKAET